MDLNFEVRNGIFKQSDDFTSPVITPEKHIMGSHRNSGIHLPDTAVLFYMHGGVEYFNRNYQTKLIIENFPRFLNSCPIYQAKGFNNLCFLNGGAGAPQAADTLETLVALGVKNVISIGMFGAFDDRIDCNDIVIPSKAFVEEGTSLHYYEKIDYSKPDNRLKNKALLSIKNAKKYPIVSTDAVYRQTFYKEALWRSKGAVGVDMETSALFSVGQYLNVNVVSILIASDMHPKSENESSWKWTMTQEVRESFFDQSIAFALDI